MSILIEEQKPLNISYFERSWLPAPQPPPVEPPPPLREAPFYLLSALTEVFYLWWRKFFARRPQA